MFSADDFSWPVASAKPGPFIGALILFLSVAYLGLQIANAVLEFRQKVDVHTVSRPAADPASIPPAPRSDVAKRSNPVEQRERPQPNTAAITTPDIMKTTSRFVADAARLWLPPQFPQETGTAQVLPLRSGPGSDAAKIDAIKPPYLDFMAATGRKQYVEDRRLGRSVLWIEVILRGRVGWVCRYYIKPL